MLPKLVFSRLPSTFASGMLFFTELLEDVLELTGDSCFSAGFFWLF